MNASLLKVHWTWDSSQLFQSSSSEESEMRESPVSEVSKGITECMEEEMKSK